MIFERVNLKKTKIAQVHLSIGPWTASGQKLVQNTELDHVQLLNG